MRTPLHIVASILGTKRPAWVAGLSLADVEPEVKRRKLNEYEQISIDNAAATNHTNNDVIAVITYQTSSENAAVITTQTSNDEIAITTNQTSSEDAAVTTDQASNENAVATNQTAITDQVVAPLRLSRKRKAEESQLGLLDEEPKAKRQRTGDVHDYDHTSIHEYAVASDQVIPEEADVDGTRNYHNDTITLIKEALKRVENHSPSQETLLAISDLLGKAAHEICKLAESQSHVSSGDSGENGKASTSGIIGENSEASTTSRIIGENGEASTSGLIAEFPPSNEGVVESDVGAEIQTPDDESVVDTEDLKPLEAYLAEAQAMYEQEEALYQQYLQQQQATSTDENVLLESSKDTIVQRPYKDAETSMDDDIALKQSHETMEVQYLYKDAETDMTNETLLAVMKTETTVKDSQNQAEPVRYESCGTQLDAFVFKDKVTEILSKNASSSAETITATASKFQFSAPSGPSGGSAVPLWEEAYKRDLESIKRAVPLVPSKNVITVQCRLRPEFQAQSQSQDQRQKQVQPQQQQLQKQLQMRKSSSTSSTSTTVATTATASKKRLQAAQVIEILDSDDEDVPVPAAKKRKTTDSSFRVGGAAHSYSQGDQDDDPSGDQSKDRRPWTENRRVISNSQRDEPERYRNIAPTPTQAFRTSSFHRANAPGRLTYPAHPPRTPVSRLIPNLGEISYHPPPDSDKEDESGEIIRGKRLPEDPFFVESEDRVDPKDIWWSQKPDDPIFYGVPPTVPKHEAEALTRYQDRVLKTHPKLGKMPAPTTGCRIDWVRYLKDTKGRFEPEAEISKFLKENLWGWKWCASERSDDDEQALQRAVATGQYRLIKGLPLVEDVEFVVLHNRARPDGDCYWRAVAQHLYGTDEKWAFVKAEHIVQLLAIFGNEGHPRHHLYASLNENFFKTSSLAEGGSFLANLWQVVHLAHAWTPAVMQQVTADLYNICLITFTINRTTRPGPSRHHVHPIHVVPEVSVRGCHNSRHVLLAFVDGNHFQPIFPNGYVAWEFRYPRASVDKTAKFAHAPKGTSAKWPVEHPWRNDHTRVVPAPVPRLHGCNFEELARWM